MNEENFINVNVDGFKEYEGVKKLFESVGCIGQENCFVIAYNRDYLPNGQMGNVTGRTARIGLKNAGITGAIFGGMVAGAMVDAANKAQEEFINSLDDNLKIIFNRDRYCGFLINRTEKGIGFIPLINDYKLLVKVEDFKTEIENFVFIPNEYIKSVEVNKLPMYFSKKLLKITFESGNNPSTAWTFPMKHKLIKYQEENYTKFVNGL